MHGRFCAFQNLPDQHILTTFGDDVLAGITPGLCFAQLVPYFSRENQMCVNIQQQMTVKSQLLMEGTLPYFKYLEDQFKRFFGGYALAYNKQENRNGALFQKRFKRISVSSEYKLVYLLGYIHHNPLHHGFCTAYEDWPHSSWRAYQQLGKASTVNREEVLRWFDEDEVKAKALFLQYHRDFRVDRKMDRYVYETSEV